MSSKLHDLARRGAWEQFEKELERTCGMASPYPPGTWVIVEQQYGKALSHTVGKIRGGNHLWLYLEQAAGVMGFVNDEGEHHPFGNGTPEEMAINRDQITLVTVYQGEPDWANGKLPRRPELKR